MEQTKKDLSKWELFKRRKEVILKSYVELKTRSVKVQNFIVCLLCTKYLRLM